MDSLRRATERRFSAHVHQSADGALHLLEVGLRWPPETFLVRKLEALAASGLRVTVASSAVFAADARLTGVSLLEIPSRHLTRRRAILALLRDGLPLLCSPRRVARLVRSIGRFAPAARSHYGGAFRLLAMCARLARERPDVVHFEWSTAATPYMPLFDVWRCPVVVSCRGTIDPRIAGRQHHLSLLPELFDRAAAVDCVCESLRRDALALGLDPAKARVIADGVDPRMFRPVASNRREQAQRGEQSFRVVTISWLRWMKGYEYALQAINALVAHGVSVRYEIIGGVPPELRSQLGERERIRYTVADLGLDRHVHLRGALGPAEVIRALQSSDSLLHPSVDEGLPTVVVEAMACGVPVVAAGCGGVGEAFADGVEGFLVAPRDPDALAEALLALWRSRSLRESMGGAGRARVLAGLTLDRQRDQFLSLYREITVLGGGDAYAADSSVTAAATSSRVRNWAWSARRSRNPR